MVHSPDENPTRDGLSRMAADRAASLEALENALCDEHVRAVVATVAGGLAHHFNNLLSGVLGLVSLAPTLDPAAMSSLGDRLKSQIDHASRLIRVVLTLTRRAHSENGVGQCEAVTQIRDAVALAAVTANGSVTVESELPNEEVLVPLSPVSLDRILLVLLTAAIDRVVGQGRVRLSLRPAGDRCEVVVSATDPAGPVPSSIAEAVALDRPAFSCVVATRLVEALGGGVEFGEDDAGLRWVVTLPVLRLS